MRRRRLAALEAGAVLAEIPHVAVDVLGIPVVRVLDDDAVERHGVAHDDGGDALDVPAILEHLDHGLLGSLVGGAPVHPTGPWREREVRIVDGLDEVRRIERRRVVAAVARVDHRLDGLRRGRLGSLGGLARLGCLRFARLAGPTRLAASSRLVGFGGSGRTGDGAGGRKHDGGGGENSTGAECG